ncbi:hypothetical protein GE09DRAFT_1169675 [Coniochaeta sp. 2T2.1]|nr:hypothetical protein GE09DRAFT_1169675 [Coniochaeta sp. 2T2.1]
MGKVYPGWQSRDPRTSSTQSLVPSLNPDEQRRTLLIVYIHGFMGNDSSFRSFPAHVHSYLKETLQETHVVHSKIYPRYKTYKAIDVARDNFSKWLEPHESPRTDVVLIGHSMGGLLAADIVLKPGTNGNQFKHRILGSISLDSPFLGLHPGIIVSGIASLFRPADKPPQDNSTTEYLPLSPQASSSMSPDPSLYSELAPPSGTASPSLPTSPSSTTTTTFAGPPDPYFNPPFFNDVQFKDRGWFKNVAHFAKKHMDENLVSAASSHIMSHLEFGGCLADYPGLMSRYNKLRALEDVDPFKGDVPPGAPRPAKVRFVNYFTISTGRIDKPKPKSRSPSPHLRPEDAVTKTTSHGSARNSLEVNLNLAATNTSHGSQRNSFEASTSKPSTPRISIEDHSDGGRPEILQLIEPVPEEEFDEQSFHSAEETANPTSPHPPSTTSTSNPPLPPTLNLPPIPDLPPAPEPPNLLTTTDLAARKLLEKEYKSARKSYDQAVKARDKAIAERAKLVKKHFAKIAKEEEKQKKADAKREKEEQKRLAKEEAALLKEVEQQQREREKVAREAEVGGQGQGQATGNSEKGVAGEDKKKKERKFCMLPRKVAGQRDSAWVQVYMEGVDEVGAHCGLFFPGPHYERLVGDVGGRIVAWVQEDMSRRAILELEDGLEGLDLD